MEVADGVGFLECPACAHQYFLWLKIIEVCGEAVYGYRAFAAMELESLLKDFPTLINEIDLQDYEDLRTVRRVTRQWEDHLNHEQRQASKRPAS